MHLLAPASPTQPTPILLTPPQKLILNRYAQLIQKSISPNTAALVTEVDYETACKCLVILVDQVHLARSPAWANPVGYGHKDHPLYQGIRFKDAIIETGIKLGMYAMSHTIHLDHDQLRINKVKHELTSFKTRRTSINSKTRNPIQQNEQIHPSTVAASNDPNEPPAQYNVRGSSHER
jgi:hypothetical protein